MSSSCVPPKGCVVHNHDPYNYDDHDDSSSECGSLCTCTSSSMTSLTSSTVSRDPSRLGHVNESSVSLAMPSTATRTHTRAATHTTTQTATQTTDSSSGGGNPYIVVFVPPQMVPGRIRTSCGNCQNHKALQEALRTSVTRVCDFFPWVAGFVIIYYAFYWWGLGPGFSAILFTVGAHAIIRFVKTSGVLECSSVNSSQPQQEDDPSEEDEEESEGEAQQQRQGGQEDVVTRDLANEKPPSYEAAVVKPPPYDLQFHLTPRQSRSQAVLNHPDDNNVIKVDFLTVPTLTVDNTKDVEGTLDDKEDLSLPSYQDAIRLSFRSDKSPMGNQERE